MTTKSTGSAKRYGNRYGRRNRARVGEIEKQYKTPGKSPFCNKNTVKRLAAGIFKCTKTGIVFAGRAYSSKRSDVKK